MIPMTTFYDPATIRRLAATGDAFYRGAAWILDQQDAARIDTTDYDAEWRRVPNARDAATPASPGVFAWSADASPIEEVRERLRARRLGLPYPARLDVDPR